MSIPRRGKRPMQDLTSFAGDTRKGWRKPFENHALLVLRRKLSNLLTEDGGDTRVIKYILRDLAAQSTELSPGKAAIMREYLNKVDRNLVVFEFVYLLGSHFMSGNFHAIKNLVKNLTDLPFPIDNRMFRGMGMNELFNSMVEEERRPNPRPGAAGMSRWIAGKLGLLRHLYEE